MNTHKEFKSLLDLKTAQELIDQGLSQGATFVDIFVEEHHAQNIEFESKKVSQIQSGIDFGIGVRLVYGKNYLYSYTNSTKKEDLTTLIKEMKKEGVSPKNLNAPKAHSSFSKTSNSTPPIAWHRFDRPQVKDQVASLSNLDQYIRTQNDKIIQSTLRTILREQYVEIFNSEGLHVQDTRPYARIAIQVIMQDGEHRSSGSESPGARGGWSFFESLDLKKESDCAIKRALSMLYAKPAPAGTMPVLMAGGFGGVIFHEACGHPLETSSVAKKASVFWDKMDTPIAHKAVSAVDDGTIDREWGSLTFDDEGTPTQKTQLIKNGILTGFLVDRLGELQTNYTRTGSGRKESYKYAPTSRMRNTYIEAGSSSFEEMLSSIDNGLYAASMGGGSVNPGTGEFNFSVSEGYRIKNGKIAEPLKGATLIGRGHEILKNISMVGKDLTLASGMCGASSGVIPTTVGQPSLKVDQILVGGR